MSAVIMSVQSSSYQYPNEVFTNSMRGIVSTLAALSSSLVISWRTGPITAVVKRSNPSSLFGVAVSP